MGVLTNDQASLCPSKWQILSQVKITINQRERYHDHHISPMKETPSVSQIQDQE